MSYNFSCHELTNSQSKPYAVAIFLPGELNDTIAPLRERFDPDYNVVESHITVVFPFETAMPLDELSAIVRDEVARVGPIEVELNSIGDYYPSVPVIFWRVKPNPALTTLHRSLYARLDLPLPNRQYSPHVTVAREISTHRVMLVKEIIVPYLPDEEFQVEAVDLISPVADHKWVSVRTFTVRID